VEKKSIVRKKGKKERRSAEGTVGTYSREFKLTAFDLYGEPDYSSAQEKKPI